MTHAEIELYSAVFSAVCAALTALIAFCGTKLALQTFAHQRTSNDVAIALGLFKEINGYWDNLSNLEPDKPKYGVLYEYNMGQILSYFEISCSMLNKGVLTEDASDILSAHIIEVFTSLEMSDFGKSLIEKCRSSNQLLMNYGCIPRKNFRRH